MKKYKLKIAQGSIPANMEFTNYEDYIEVLNEDNQTIILYDNEDIPLLLEQGIIEEVQELKWTDDDMISFFKYINHMYLMEENLPYHTILKEYEKSRQNKE
jgi:hypothetical protein